MIEGTAGEVIGEPVEAHKELTGAFRKWFTGPDWCHGSLHEGEYFNTGSDNAEAFLRDTQYTGVPEELRQLIHCAIKRVLRRTKIESELEEAFAEVPNLDEFTEAIRWAKETSSASVNGVSYDMLKTLPNELLANFHYCLTRIWQERGTPGWWSDRWLVAIPKKEHDTVNVGDLRPLILVDTVRKLWCNILLQRMLAIWKKHDVHSTDSAPDGAQ